MDPLLTLHFSHSRNIPQLRKLSQLDLHVPFANSTSLSMLSQGEGSPSYRSVITTQHSSTLCNLYCLVPKTFHSPLGRPSTHDVHLLPRSVHTVSPSWQGRSPPS